MIPVHVGVEKNTSIVVGDEKNRNEGIHPHWNSSLPWSKLYRINCYCRNIANEASAKLQACESGLGQGTLEYWNNG